MEDTDESVIIGTDHDRLISAISKLDKTQHINEPSRNEPTNLHSEFNLIKKSNKLSINKFVKVLDDTANHVLIGKKLIKSQDRSKVLPKPLEKPQLERIKRATGYKVTKEKVGRWDPIVARNRTVDYVSFPLKQMQSKLEPTKEFLEKFEFKSSLEKELDEIDPPVKDETTDEKEDIYPITYQEMLEHRQQVAKLRAQQSYKAAKSKRQSKIKSKKYHRILKKEKMKLQLKEFEELQKKDPEEALKKLEALEKARALERHTLRHKNTGKWAKSKLVRAKYDKEVRQQLAEQLAVSRNLTEKVQDNISTDDEIEDDTIIPDITLAGDPKNSWIMQKSDNQNLRKTSKIPETFNQPAEKRKSNKSHGKNIDNYSEPNNLEYLMLKSQKKKPIIDEELIESGPKSTEDSQANSQILSQLLSNTIETTKNSSEDNIAVNRFPIVTKYLNTSIPQGENELDLLDDNEQVVPRINIESVFDDDVVASFRKEKESEIDKDKPTDIDLSMPGWGSWGGKGVRTPKRKRNRFILKAAPKVPRRDENKGDIIIKEFKDPKLAAHKVTDVPFPFSGVKDYEASIRLPISNTFIPEKAHKKLIRPNVITKLGTIIEPMDEDELLVMRKRNFRDGSAIKLLGKK